MYHRVDPWNPWLVTVSLAFVAEEETPEWQAGTAWRSCLGSHGPDSERSVTFVPMSYEGEAPLLKKQLFCSGLPQLTTGAVFMMEMVICIQKAAFYFIHILKLLHSYTSSEVFPGLQNRWHRYPLWSWRLIVTFISTWSLLWRVFRCQKPRLIAAQLAGLCPFTHCKAPSNTLLGLWQWHAVYSLVKEIQLYSWYPNLDGNNGRWRMMNTVIFMGSVRVRGKNELFLGALIRTFNLATHFLL